MNRDRLLKFVLFTVGAAIGSAVTWKFVKTKYERIAQEEIDSVKNEYASLVQSMKNKLKESVVKNDEDNGDDEYYPDDDERDFTEKEKAQIVEYHKLVSKYRGNDADEDDEGDKNNEEGDNGGEDEDEVPYINGPYVISADEFNSSPPGYNAQPLDYFADGVLADGWGVRLDIEETIGEDSLSHFGEDEDDILYVRNERNEIDYEITRDPRTYEEVLRTNPDPYYGR